MKRMDREKVIKGYMICVEHGLLNGEDCHGYHQWKDNHYEIEKINDYSKECPYNGCETGCVKTLAKDTLALLKEQKPVKAIPTRMKVVRTYNDIEYNYCCGGCGSLLRAKWVACPCCGKAVKWNA